MTNSTTSPIFFTTRASDPAEAMREAVGELVKRAWPLDSAVGRMRAESKPNDALLVQHQHGLTQGELKFLVRAVQRVVTCADALPAEHSPSAGAGWRPIASAPKSQWPWVIVYAPPFEDLSAIVCPCQWHPDAGHCVDELRHVTHWQPLPAAPGASPSPAPVELAWRPSEEALRDTLVSMRGWVQHWQRDVEGNLKPTDGSLAQALGEIDAALKGRAAL